jgi:hypothetical protein
MLAERQDRALGFVDASDEVAIVIADYLRLGVGVEFAFECRLRQREILGRRGKREDPLADLVVRRKQIPHGNGSPFHRLVVSTHESQVGRTARDGDPD